METVIIVGSLIVLFVITWIVIACNAPSEVFPKPTDVRTFLEFDLESKLAYERRVNQRLREELEYVKMSCRLHHQPPFLGCDGCHHTTRYFAQTVEHQKMADMLARAKDSAKQLVKDLSA